MYILSEKLIDQYEIEIKDIKKIRNAYLCIGEDKKILLRPFAGSMERGVCMNEFLKKLKEAHIFCDEIILTKEGNVVAKDMDDKGYYAIAYVEGNECNCTCGYEATQGVKILAQIHNKSIEIADDINGNMGNTNDIIKEYERHNREFIKVRNYIRGKHRHNEFESLYMHSYSREIEKALKVTEILKELRRKQEMDGRSIKAGLCHGNYNQHNILMVNQKIYITNFNQLRYDALVGDLSTFMRKILEKNNWDITFGRMLLEAYEECRTMVLEEYEELYLRLAYPEKFWKITNHYFNSNKAWISVRDIEKLKKVIEQEENREKFLTELAKTYVPYLNLN